jgi:hypothetical protein
MLRTAAQALVILIGAAFLVVWANNIPRPQAAQSSYHQHSNETHESQCSEKTPETWGERLACDPVAGFTGLLALFTFVLGAVAIIQIDFLRRADITARLAAEAANKAATAAETHTAIIAAQTDVLAKQHAVGRLQHLALHRPRLRIRHISIVDRAVTLIRQPGFFFDDGEKIEGGLVVVNVGGTKATVIDSFYRKYFSKSGLPINSPLDKDGPKEPLIVPNKVFDIGESLAIGIRDTIIMKPAPEEGTTILRRFKNEGWKIYVMGQIRYQDEGGHDRFMGFCRVGDGETRFAAVDDPDYEYED